MVIHRVLDEVLRSWSHVAVLRTLLDTATGFTGNEIARLSGMHPLSALKALSSLEVLGIVRRQRGGRDHIFTLNRNHFVVKEGLLNLYHAERRMPDEIVEVLSGALKRKAVSAMIFGSVARKQEIPESDLDLCCVVKTDSQKESVRKVLLAESAGLHATFGVKLAPLFLTVKELRKRQHSPVVSDMLAHGVLVSGHPIRTLLNDKAPKEKAR